MSNNASGESKGLFGSLTRLASTLVAIIHTRLELFSTDLADVRAQLISLLLLALAALFFIGVCVVLVTILLVARSGIRTVCWCWDRLPGSIWPWG